MALTPLPATRFAGTRPCAQGEGDLLRAAIIAGTYQLEFVLAGNGPMRQASGIVGPTLSCSPC